MRKLVRGYAAIGMTIFALTTAEEAYSADDPAAKVFVQAIVDAINRKDDEARKRLMHPAALTCSQMQSQAMAMGGYTLKWDPIPDNYRWQITPMPAGAAGWFPDKFDYPVPPTHQLQIDFDTAPNRSQGIVLQIVHYRDEWREITGCPKATTSNEAKEAAKVRTQQNDRIRKLTATISPKLKSELRQLLAEGRKVDAIIRYRNVMNEDLAIAKGVIELLQEEGGNNDGLRNK